ncbi:MAG: hypothetical protein RLZZ427_779 [Pseudomonadota bacterium]|jgi:hypothetical protein
MTGTVQSRPAAALRLLEIDAGWVAGRGAISLPERVAMVQQAGAFGSVALYHALIAVAQAVEADGAALACRGGELPYHNRDHIHDVLMAWGQLCATGLTGLDAEAQGSVLAALIAHDLAHDGTINRHPYELEARAWRAIHPVLEQAGVPPAVQRTIRATILATDPASYRRWGAGACADTPLRRGFKLAVAADLFASLLPGHGFAQGALLAREQAGAGLPDRAAALQTLAGRAAFLRHVPELGPAAEACGLPDLIAHQLAVIAALDEADRDRAWNPAHGAAFVAAVAGSLAAA